MGLDDLVDTVEDETGALGEELTVDLDRETRHELAMLVAGLDGEPEELCRRAVHLLFQTTVDTGKLDFHLRGAYDVTYDEYLAGLTYEEMGGPAPSDDDDRRYQF
jgi:hypothetical protein